MNGINFYPSPIFSSFFIFLFELFNLCVYDTVAIYSKLSSIFYPVFAVVS